MKYLLALALLTSVAFANEHEGAKAEHKSESTSTEKVETKQAKENKREDKRAAYKASKEECLKENKDLKGKELTKCIVSKNK